MKTKQPTTQKTTTKANKPIESKTTPPKKRILGSAKGLIIESPDCWDDDFND